MKKAVLFSIKPKHCEQIISGKKTVEVRKRIPKISVPFTAYIYETKGRKIITPAGGVLHEGRGKVIGEFICNRILCRTPLSLIVKEEAERILKGTCLSEDELLKYIGYQKGTDIYAKDYSFYLLHISDLVIYEEPKDLSEFKTFCKSYYDGDKCDDCKYFINGDCYEYDESDCGCNGLKPIERPPQSWCYVEKLRGVG